MNKSSLFFLFRTLCLSLILSSCQEEIDLELNNSDPLIVIEGSISNQLQPQVVKVSKTISFSDKNHFSGFSGAQVILKTEEGGEVPFIEDQRGIYISPEFEGIPGHQYQLDVKVDGKVYSATSVMPKPVVLDSVTFERLTFLGNSNIYPVANYKDPVSAQNQYFFVLRMNDQIVDNIVVEDRFNNGNNISDILLYELEDYASGDSLVVDMQCIDRNVFKYYYSIDQISGQNGPPVAPANPVSNFSNGALGIFNAHTSSRVTVVFR